MNARSTHRPADFANWRLPEIVGPGQELKAANLLVSYFRRRLEPRRNFSGSRFERLYGGGDRPDVADRFTAEDFVAISMLGVSVPAHSALVLMGDFSPDTAREIGRLLRKLPRELSLADAILGTPGNDGDHYSTMDRLWNIVISQKGLGVTTTSKLLARKRPHLFPVLDSVVKKELAPEGRAIYDGVQFWRSLQRELIKDDRALEKRLRTIRTLASAALRNLGDSPAQVALDDISILRVFDVIVWMTGKGYKPEDWEP